MKNILYILLLLVCINVNAQLQIKPGIAYTFGTIGVGLIAEINDAYYINNDYCKYTAHSEYLIMNKFSIGRTIMNNRDGMILCQLSYNHVVKYFGERIYLNPDYIKKISCTFGVSYKYTNKIYPILFFDVVNWEGKLGLVFKLNK